MIPKGHLTPFPLASSHRSECLAHHTMGGRGETLYHYLDHSRLMISSNKQLPGAV